MPHPPELLQRLPLARGLVRLWASLAPIFRRRGVAPSTGALADRRRASLAPLGLAFSAARWSTVAGIRFSVAAPLHDPARPRAAPARRRAPRDRRGRGAAARADVGGRGAAVALLAALRHELRGARAARHLPRRPAAAARAGASGRRSVVLVLSLALTMELWRIVQRSSHRFWQSFLVPGLALQRADDARAARSTRRRSRCGGARRAPARARVKLDTDAPR